MFSFFNKKKAPQNTLTREQSLKSIPIQNIGIREIEENGTFKIIYKRDAPLFAGLVKRFNLPQPEKTIIMDEIGTYVWRLIDGKKTTEEIIEIFRKKYPLPRREAEVSIVAHLKNLMTRGAISVIIKN